MLVLILGVMVGLALSSEIFLLGRMLVRLTEEMVGILLT